MDPIKTPNSNLVYAGNSPGVRDLHCQRVVLKDEHTGAFQGNAILSVWQPNQAEREAIAKGANVRLWIMAEPIPPVYVDVVDEQPVDQN